MQTNLYALVNAGVLVKDDEDEGYYVSFVLGEGYSLHVYDGTFAYIPVVYVQTIVEDNDVVYFTANDREPITRHSVGTDWDFRVYKEITDLEGLQ